MWRAPGQLLPEEVSDAQFAANVAVLKLTARVEDDQLRNLVIDLRERIVNQELARSEAEAVAAMQDILIHYEGIQRRFTFLFGQT